MKDSSGHERRARPGCGRPLMRPSRDGDPYLFFT